jgi:hypothetical protein
MRSNITLFRCNTQRTSYITYLFAL